MILADVNILIHAYNRDSPDHPAARQWWEEALSYPGPGIGLAWVVVMGFIRIATGRSAFVRPWSVDDGVAIARSWLSLDTVQIVTPGERHGAIFFRLLEQIGTAGNLTTDAHLAALALEYRAEIATTDTDFARFRGVRWFNPLAVKKR